MPGVFEFARQRAEAARQASFRRSQNPGNERFRDAIGSDQELGGPEGLQGLVEEYFVPNYEEQAARNRPIEDAFLGQVGEVGGLGSQALEAAQAYAAQLFKPGGSFAQQVAGGTGRTMAAGFNPENRRGLVANASRAAGEDVSRYFTQQFGDLERARIAAFGGYVGQGRGLEQDALTSLFTGVAGAEQLELAGKEPDKGILSKGMGFLF